jgi:hypothetical protein
VKTSIKALIMIGMTSDIAEIKEREVIVRRYAIPGARTGIFNRHIFRERFGNGGVPTAALRITIGHPLH